MNPAFVSTVYSKKRKEREKNAPYMFDQTCAVGIGFGCSHGRCGWMFYLIHLAKNASTLTDEVMVEWTKAFVP